MKKQAEEAQIAKFQDEDLVRQLRAKKQMLLTTITSGQKVILKGCYSRPTWPFNNRLHEMTLKEDNLAQALINQQEEFQSKVEKTLLQRI